MAFRTRIYHPAGKPGIWPNGEPQSVRDAYDALLAEQAQEQENNSGSSKTTRNTSDQR